jgi:N-acetylmuramoyl-L-alanine amidase
MDRRAFIHFFGKSFLAASILSLSPRSLWGASALECAFEGQNCIQRGEYAKAVISLKEAVRLDPGNDWAYGLLGRAYHGLGQSAEALAAFREAVRLNPDDTYSRMMAEIIAQKPVPRLKKAEKPPSLLEKEAGREEERMLNSLRSEEGLRYQVQRVVIDAGHGGFDPGAVGKSGLKEKDITLDIARQLQQRLEKIGKKQAFLTRTDDYFVPLAERTVIANQYRADLFISLHINANPKQDPSGSETYFCSEQASSKEAARVAASENAVSKYDQPAKKKEGYIDVEDILFRFERKLYWDESSKFAKRFQDGIKKSLPLQSRGIHSADFSVLRTARMPAILIETGFISNPGDEANLAKSAFRDQIAEAIAGGIL